MVTRWSQMQSKEVIDVGSGDRLGFLEDAELLIDEETGRIDSMEFRSSSKFVNFFGLASSRSVGWNHIEQVGPGVILVSQSSEDEHKV